jgi:hypothetical protein
MQDAKLRKSIGVNSAPCFTGMQDAGDGIQDANGAKSRETGMPDSRCKIYSVVHNSVLHTLGVDCQIHAAS